jgi:hypothetical protein
MSELLKNFNKAGLIEKLEGKDERVEKIETAASNVAKALSENPPALIRAVLAGLDPDITADDPAIAQAADALLDVWASVRSVHTDPPIFIYRSILLDACNQVAEGLNAVILWYTAADTLPLARLGREESIVRAILTEWAQKAEKFSLVVPTLIATKRVPVTKKIEPLDFEEASAVKVNRDALRNNIAAASGPNYRNEVAIEGANPQWTNAPKTWSWDFTDRMTQCLATRLDAIYNNLAENQKGMIQQLQKHEAHQLDTVKEMLSIQRSWLQEFVKTNNETNKAEHLRLNTLWWCEALYSQSLCKSYRELDPVIAAIVMPVDLLAEVHLPTPASVTYALSETVGRLPEAPVDKEYNLLQILEQIHVKGAVLPGTWKQDIISPPESGRLSLRDLILSALLVKDHDFKRLAQRSGLDENFTISLPCLARAIFRQEQAVLLAEAK